MKYSYSILFIALLISTASCGLFQEKIMIKDAVAEKSKLDATENPAMKSIMLDELKNKKVIITDALVQDVIYSSNIDYDFCVIVDLTTEQGPVQCYVYTKNRKKMSELEKGKTVIDVEGQFGRFFSMLDNYFTKVEIFDAGITVKNKAEQN